MALGRPRDSARGHRGRIALGCGLLVSAFALLSPWSTPARAASAGAGCSASALTQPFAPWGDKGFYELVPQGDFEGSLTQWTLGVGAHRGSSSEPYGVTGRVGSYSLALTGGASAQSPYMCVDTSYPTFRFFARSDGLLTTLAVSVVYKTVLGTLALPLGLAAPGAQWEPSAPMLTGSAVAGLLTGGSAQAALRFTALTGAAEVDDVYLDPRMR